VFAFVISSDSDEAAILSRVLQRAGLKATVSNDLDSALANWTARPPRIVVASVLEPRPTIAVSRLREATLAPLIVTVDSRVEELHRALLDTGADLVLTRPYSASLLISQVRALLRRDVTATPGELPLSQGGLTLDPVARTVQVGDRPPRHLSTLEFRLLRTLMLHRGQVLPAEVLVEQVWGYTGTGNRDLVHKLVSRLRAKIEPNPRSPTYVLTVRSIGYRFDGEEAS
jgi:DNA-binding response OmpR family regulator